MVTRRLFYCLFLTSLTLQSAIGNDEVFDLKVEFAKNSQCRILTEVEHDGQVLVNPENDQDRTKSLPLKVTGKLKYFQRTTSGSQAIRYFEQATASIKLEQGKSEPELADDNRVVIARIKTGKGGRPEMASIANILEQQELELIQNPADPLSLEKVFSRNKVEIGKPWDPDLTALSQFLGVDEIVSSDVQLRVKSKSGKQARIFLSGSVIADINDVTTEMSISGIAVIDHEQHQILNLKLGIDEQRPIGQIEPGFDGRTRIDIGFQHGKETDQLSNEALAKIVRSKKIQQRLKYEAQQGGFCIIYDPRWKLIAGEQDTALLRFIDGGQLLTQCSVVLLPARPADKPLTLDVFKKEIAKAIDANSQATLLTSGQNTTSTGLNALQVVVAGEEDGLPVNWFYYHVSNDEGRQLTFVFTLAESVAGRVKGVANQLVDEFRFTERKSSVAASKSPSKR